MSPSLPQECLDISGTVACSPWGPSNFVNTTAISEFYSSILSDKALANIAPNHVSAATDWERLVYAVTGRGSSTDAGKFCADRTSEIRYYRSFVCARDIFGLSAGCNSISSEQHPTSNDHKQTNSKTPKHRRREIGTRSASLHTNAVRLLEASITEKQSKPMCPEICDAFSKSLGEVSSAHKDLDARCLPAKDQSSQCSTFFGKAVRNEVGQKLSGKKEKRQIVVTMDEEKNTDPAANTAPVPVAAANVVPPAENTSSRHHSNVAPPPQVNAPTPVNDATHAALIDAIHHAPAVDEESHQEAFAPSAPPPAEKPSSRHRTNQENAVDAQKTAWDAVPEATSNRRHRNAAPVVDAPKTSGDAVQDAPQHGRHVKAVEDKSKHNSGQDVKKAEDKKPKNEKKVEDKKPKNEKKVEDKKPKNEKKVEDKKPKNEKKVEDKKPKNEKKVEDKKPKNEKKVEDKKNEKKVEDKKNEKKVEDKKPKNEKKVEDKKNEKKVEDKKNEKKVEDKKPKNEKKAEDKKPKNEKKESHDEVKHVKDEKKKEAKDDKKKEEKKNEKTDKKSKAVDSKKNGVKPKNEAENACLQGVDDDEASCGFAGNIDRAIKFCESTKNADPCCHKLSDPSSTVNAMTSLLTALSNVDTDMSAKSLLESFHTNVAAKFDESHHAVTANKKPADTTFSGITGLNAFLRKSITALGLPQDLKEDATKTKPVVNPIDSMPKLDDGDEEEEAITDVKVNQVPIDAPPSKTKAKKSPPSKTKAASKSKKSGTGASKKKNATSRAGLKNPKQTNAPGSDGKSSFWSAGAIAGVAVGCVLVVGGIIAGVVVVQRRGSRIKKPFTIKKFNHNPLLGGNGGNGAATGASTALLGGGGSGGGGSPPSSSYAGANSGGAGPVGVVSGDLRPRRVIYDYEPVQPDEILLTPGDLVEVSVEYDDGWATGKNLSTGRIGTFPVTCLAK